MFKQLEGDLCWESVGDRAKFLGLSIFHKTHLNLARPIIGVNLHTFVLVI